MQEQKSTAGQGIGIGGLILGIVAIPLAIIPCTFPLAIVLASAGIILSAVGLSQASRLNGPRGLPVAGLVVSIIGVMIALMWGLFIAASVNEDGRFWKNEIMEKITREVEDGMEDAFEDMDQEFEQLDKDLENLLEDLEWEENWEDFTWQEEMLDQQFRKIITAYDDLINNLEIMIDEAEQEVVGLSDEYVDLIEKLAALTAKIAEATGRFSEEQKEKFEKLQKKYEKALREAEMLEEDALKKAESLESED